MIHDPQQGAGPTGRRKRHYEELRSYALGDWCSNLRDSPFKAVGKIVGEGMAGWMRAWEAVVERSPSGKNDVPRKSDGGPSVPEWPEQAANLLADLAVARLRNCFP